MDDDTQTLGIVVKKGSRQRMRPFVDRAEAARLEGAPGGYRLVQVGLDKEEVLGTWDNDDVDSRREIWFDEVMEMVNEATEVEGVKTAFWLIAWERAGKAERIINKYKIVAQPAEKNMSPSPEGLVHQAMTHTNRAFTALLAERGAVTGAFREALEYYKKENERLQGVIDKYQRREDSFREQQWALLERERELVRAEASSEVRSAEISSERIERIAGKLGDAVEQVGLKMGQTAVERLSPAEIVELINNNKDLVKMFFPGSVEGH